jgi:Bacterial regulatory helix-turn-helix protein, lysR family
VVEEAGATRRLTVAGVDKRSSQGFRRQAKRLGSVVRSKATRSTLVAGPLRSMGPFRVMGRLPPLGSLYVFAVAARHLSFTAAAEDLHRTKSAVSHRIKALEAEIRRAVVPGAHARPGADEGGRGARQPVESGQSEYQPHDRRSRPGRGRESIVRDHRVSWPKPKARPDWMSREDYAALPDELTLRDRVAELSIPTM